MAKKLTTPRAKNQTPLPWDTIFDRIATDIDIIAQSESTDKNKKIRMMASWNTNHKAVERHLPLFSYERAVIKTSRDSISQSTLDNITMEETIKLFHLVMDTIKKGA